MPGFNRRMLRRTSDGVRNSPTLNGVGRRREGGETLAASAETDIEGGVHPRLNLAGRSFEGEVQDRPNVRAGSRGRSSCPSF